MDIKKLTIPLITLISFSVNASLESDLNKAFTDVNIYSQAEGVTQGYLRDFDSNVGGFFIFDESSSELHFEDKKYIYNQGNFIPLSAPKLSSFKKDVMPYFADKYGLQYSSGTGDDIYVFLDYSCPFSRSFVNRGNLKSLASSGDNVWILPISRLGQSKGIIDYGKLHCFENDNKAKLSTFLDWMSKGDSVGVTDKKLTRDCNYWGDLKPYYSIVSHLGVSGVPAIIRGSD